MKWDDEILIRIFWDELVKRSHPFSDMEYGDFIQSVEVMNVFQAHRNYDPSKVGGLDINFIVKDVQPRFFDIYCEYSEYSDRVSKKIRMKREGVLDSILDL